MTTLCLNLLCPQPQNPDGLLVCNSCGQPLLLTQRYRPLKLVGQGGFGRTLLALDLTVAPPKPCVIKQSWRRDRAAEAQSGRFQQEAERLRQLGSHPQIPALLAYFETDQGQFLVQQYIAGETLAAQLQSQGSWDEAAIRRLLGDILPVLEYIHSHQVIHRDIKPANLIAPPTGPLVLVDFGAAKALDSDPANAQTATIIGSAGYSAPEQALGKATSASDLYGLGVTCLNLLTGLHPFDLYSLSEDRWVWRTYLPAPISNQLAQVLDQLVARGLRQRYSNAAAVLADLAISPLPVKTLPLSARWGRKPKVPPPVSLPPLPSWPAGRQIHLPSGLANGLAISPDGRAIAAALSDQSVRLWDLANGDLIHTFGRRWGLFGVGHHDAVMAVAFSPDGAILYSASRDGQLKAWELSRYRAVGRWPTQGWGTCALALSPDGQTLITAGGEGKIRLWRSQTGTLQTTLSHHQDWVSSLAISPDGHHLISGSWDKTLRHWHLPTGRLLQTLTTAARITAVVCSRDRAFSGDSQGQLQSWRLGQPGPSECLHQQAGAITALALSPNQQWIACGSEEGAIALAQIDQLDQPARWATLKAGWGVYALAFTPDSRTLVSSSGDALLQLWHAPT